MRDEVDCRCGHLEDMHILDIEGQLDVTYCSNCYMFGFECSEYRMDSLKLLEYRYEQKEKL